MNTVHVAPVGDLVEHDTDTDGCVCCPTAVPVERDDGTFGWVAVHHSLDGREAQDPAERPRCQHISPSPWGTTQCALPEGHEERHAYDPAEDREP